LQADEKAQPKRNPQSDEWMHEDYGVTSADGAIGFFSWRQVRQ
jgi:hypothetical protein